MQRDTQNFEAVMLPSNAALDPTCAAFLEAEDPTRNQRLAALVKIVTADAQRQFENKPGKKKQLK